VKRCETCGREAKRLAIFELHVAPGILPRLPHRWVCPEHEQILDIVFKNGEPYKQLLRQGIEPGKLDVALFKKTWDDFMRRLNPEFVADLCAREVQLSLGPSNLTEAQGDEVRQAALEQGRTVKTREVDVEVMTPEEAAREIARMN
jgi:hypothetical protein